MKNEISIQDIETIILMCDDLKKKATGLRNQLERFHAPAPKGGKLSAKDTANILYKRNMQLYKKSKIA